MGLHDLGATEEGPGVSMHVYCPPYYYCNVFEMDGSKREVSMMAATAPSREHCPPPPLVYGLTPPLSPLTPLSIDDGDVLPISALMTAMDSFSSTKDEVVAAFSRTFVTATEWKTFAHFSEGRFQRLLLHSNEKYSLLMLAWLPGQATPPHDHRGSESWVKLIAGELTLTIFQEGSPDPAAEEKQITIESKTFYEAADLRQHIMSNKSNTFAVSLHLYSPPYTDLHYSVPRKDNTELSDAASLPAVDCCTIRCGVSNISSLVRQVSSCAAAAACPPTSPCCFAGTPYRKPLLVRLCGTILRNMGADSEIICPLMWWTPRCHLPDISDHSFPGSVLKPSRML